MFIGRSVRGDERLIKLGLRQLQSYSGVNLTPKRRWYSMHILENRIVALCNKVDSLPVETDRKNAISATRDVNSMKRYIMFYVDFSIVQFDTRLLDIAEPIKFNP